MLTLGSMCSGYAGLDQAIASVLPVRTAWFADPDPGATAVLAHHWPSTPNHGDITAVDWAQVEPVDIVTAGYPCQPFSSAGQQRGTADERHIWPYIAAGIRILRPRYVFLENVANHLRIGFADVLADLARGGFDAEWALVRASDVGAPHQRERLFVVARAADAQGEGLQGSRLLRQPAQRGGAAAADADDLRGHGGAGEHGTDRGAVPARDAAVAWGRYAQTIGRWERIMGRPAPHPTGPTATGGIGIAPEFVEWMMGLPAGHVTDVPGLTRNQMLHLLGNGVVPRQGAEAVRLLLDRMAVAA